MGLHGSGQPWWSGDNDATAVQRLPATSTHKSNLFLLRSLRGIQGWCLFSNPTPKSPAKFRLCLFEVTFAGIKDWSTRTTLASFREVLSSGEVPAKFRQPSLATPACTRTRARVATVIPMSKDRRFRANTQHMVVFGL